MIAEATKNMAPRRLGDMIRLIRYEKRFSLKDVSNRSGLSASYLSDIELNRTLPSHIVSARIARNANKARRIVSAGQQVLF